MDWDPGSYLRFAGPRHRPGLELLARIPDLPARHVADLGCGPGALTSALARRWPAARIFGVDSSAAMMELATRDAGIEWVTAGIDDWEPPVPLDVVYSNAALHWLGDHDRLFPRLAGMLAPRGTLAVQMPNNWREPTHTVPAELLETGRWPAAAVTALPRRRVAEPSWYRRLLDPLVDEVDVWETTYHHVLEPDPGVHPVLAWVKGSVLRPVLEALDEDERRSFEEACAAAYAAAYPPDTHGRVVMTFRRLFLVAVRGS